MIRVRNGRPGNQIMMERTENRRWPDELGLGPAQQIEPRRVGQNSSAQVGQNSWTQPVDTSVYRLSAYLSRVRQRTGELAKSRAGSDCASYHYLSSYGPG